MKKVLLLILFLFIAFSFLSLSRNPLQNDDASLYALAAKNAIVHNQWLAQFVTPGDGSSFLDKPPLGIWLLAWLPKLIGVNELTIHIPNVIYYLLLLLILCLFLSRFEANKDSALYSTLIAATSLCLVVYSRAPKLDVLLTLFVMTAHFSLFAFLKRDNSSCLIPLALALACGFLVKSGFGLLLPGLTMISLFIFKAEARRKFSNALSTFYFPLSAFLFLIIVGGVLCLQAIPLKDQFIPYLKAITIQSKYNTSYLGFGLNTSVFGFLLITIFPWTPLALASLFDNLKLKSRFSLSGTANLFVGSTLNLRSFCLHWFWSNLFFLFFFYRQNDLRTFTVFVPPMAILAGMKLTEVLESAKKPRRLRRAQSSRLFAGFRADLAGSIFFLVIFSIILAYLLIRPVNPSGVDVSAAVLPIALFAAALALFTFFCLKPSPSAFALCFAFIALSYSVLFYNTRPLADSFNPDVKWPGKIKAEREAGSKFYIYRPPDRKLFYSPDLFYVDFMAGPADRYYWKQEEMRRDLVKGKAILLSDTASWGKLHLTGRTVAQDDYSRLVVY